MIESNFNNDRPDIQLERDRAYENRPPLGYTRWEDYYADEEAKAKAFEYGTSANAKHLAIWIEEMLQAECYGRLLLKSEVLWPEDLDLGEALEDACIQLGLSSEEFAPSVHDQGHEIDLRLV